MADKLRTTTRTTRPKHITLLRMEVEMSIDNVLKFSTDKIKLTKEETTKETITSFQTNQEFDHGLRKEVSIQELAMDNEEFFDTVVALEFPNLPRPTFPLTENFVLEIKNVIEDGINTLIPFDNYEEHFTDGSVEFHQQIIGDPNPDILDINLNINEVFYDLETVVEQDLIDVTPTD